MAALTVGKKAPLFTLPSDGGQDISLSDYKGGKVILYFYPKDNTSGCTLEAQAFRANLEEFKKRGYSVLGVSRDSVKKHCNFRDKYELNFPLLSHGNSIAYLHTKRNRIPTGCGFSRAKIMRQGLSRCWKEWCRDPRRTPEPPHRWGLR